MLAATVEVPSLSQTSSQTLDASDGHFKQPLDRRLASADAVWAVRVGTHTAFPRCHRATTSHL